VEGERHRKAVLAFVEELSASGEPMPTNGKISEHLKLTLGMVKWAIRKLTGHGIISFELRGSKRRFVISSTGAATGWSQQEKPESSPAVKAMVSDTRRGKLVDMIRRCAQAGEVLPANIGIAEEFGCAGDTIRRDLHYLVRSGVISIESIGSKRRITIVKTGEVTPWSVGGCGIGRVSRATASPPLPPDPVAEEVEKPVNPYCLAPCARYGCADFVALGKAYCAIHETEDVLEWPVVALESVEEDLAA